MKKLLTISSILALLCATLALGAFAAKTDYGYYDYDGNGTVEFADAMGALTDALNGGDVSLLRVMHTLKGAVASTKLAATVTSIDKNAGIATVSTEYFENITIPLSMLGLDKSVSAADYNGVPAVISLHAPASKFADNYKGGGEGVYLIDVNKTFEGTPQNAVSKLYTIDELNKTAVNGSHASDNYKTASLELNFRNNVVLTSAKTTYTRYDNAWYPRIKKINDNLYLLVYMYSQYGQHLYYVTSTDGVNWNAPKVLWNSANYEAFTYTSGTLSGTSDRYHAMNPDACVLDDGTIICVYAVRAVKGYRHYPDYSGLFIKKGTPTASGDITWSEEEKIYTGQVWEPSIMQRSDGQVHVYFTQVAPDIVQYGYDEDHRSTETGLIVSNDRGNTWTPNIQAGNTNYYRATTIFREYVGYKDGRKHYNGQMPVTTELYNGKLLVATEIKQLNGSFRISYGISNANGEWKKLAVGEESTYTKLDVPPTSSPYVDRFTSGEIYLTYNYWHNGADHLIGRIGKPDGSEFNSFFYNAPDSTGIWGACDVMDSHKAATVSQDLVSTTTADDGTVTNIYGLNIFYHYLNHRINAKETSVILDGFINEWERNSDALFVGSETQAQSTVQVAHDRDNLYLLITRLDKFLTNKDSFSLNIAAGSSSYYTVTVTVKGAYTITYTSGGTTTNVSSGDTAAIKRFGTVDINTNVDQGIFMEVAIPKANVGLSGKTSFKTIPTLTNKDTSSTVTTDTIDGASMSSTTYWIEVVLD